MKPPWASQDPCWRTMIKLINHVETIHRKTKLKQPWSGKTTFYHQDPSFLQRRSFSFFGLLEFPISNKSAQSHFSQDLDWFTWAWDVSCHAYVLNSILCINLHFAVLIYNLFILPRIWFHPSHDTHFHLFHPMFFRVHVGSKMCVQENVEHIHQTAGSQAVVSCSSLSVSLPGGSKWHRPNLGTVAGTNYITNLNILNNAPVYFGRIPPKSPYICIVWYPPKWWFNDAGFFGRWIFETGPHE